VVQTDVASKHGGLCSSWWALLPDLPGTSGSLGVCAGAAGHTGTAAGA